MIRTVVAIQNDALRQSIVGILQKNGIEVRITCSSGREAIRAVKRMDGGVIVCSARLHDMTADSLADALRKEAFFLCVGKPGELDYCENEDLFKVPLPVRSGELIGALNILLQLDERAIEKRIPHRSEAEKHVIKEAKDLLMYQQEMSEDQAYRFIQKRSMETSTPMTEVAQLILNSMQA